MWNILLILPLTDTEGEIKAKETNITEEKANKSRLIGKSSYIISGTSTNPRTDQSCFNYRWKLFVNKRKYCSVKWRGRKYCWIFQKRIFRTNYFPLILKKFHSWTLHVFVIMPNWKWRQKTNLLHKKYPNNKISNCVYSESW